MGNPLLGDEGVAWAVARRMADDARLPADAYVTWGGTDLLAAGSLLDDRQRVVLIDAVEDTAPGRLVPLEPGEGEDGTDAHTLGLGGAVRLVRMLCPSVARARVHVLGITIPPVHAGADLSPALRARVPEWAERILTEYL